MTNFEALTLGKVFGKRYTTILSSQQTDMNLTLIGNTWYAILMVPKQHRERVGRSKFQKSLQTGNKSLAQQRAQPLLAAWRQIIGRGDNWEQRAIEVSALRSVDFMTYAEAKSAVLSQVLADTKPSTMNRAFELEAIMSGKKILLVSYRQRFQTFLESKNKLQTVQIRMRDIDVFLAEFSTPEDVNKQTLNEWFKKLRLTKTDGSIKRTLVAVKDFWGLVAELEDLPQMEFKLPKLDAVPSKQTQRQAFTDGELLTLLEASRTAGKHADSLYKCIKIGMYSGMRVEEICRLQRTNIIQEDVLLFDIRDSKTAAGVRRIPVHHELLPLLKDLPERYLIESTPDKAGRRSNTVVQAFSKLKNRLGFGANKTFHSIRHTVNTKLMQSGKILVVNELIGHANSKSNQGLNTYYHGADIQELSALIHSIRY